MTRSFCATTFLLVLALAAAGCSGPDTEQARNRDKAAGADRAPAGPAADTPAPDTPEHVPDEPGPEPPDTTDWEPAPAPDKDAVRALVAPLLDPCAATAEQLAGPFADTVEYDEWGTARNLPREDFVQETLTWRCEAIQTPGQYETIPVDQRIVNVIAAGPGGHKFAHQFHPPGTGVTEEDRLRCDHAVPPGQARVLVADRILQGDALSWPPYGDWQGLMYYVREIDGALKITKYGSCPESDTLDLSQR